MAPRKGEKDQHIQVSVRCRPLNSIEKRQSSYSVVETIPEKREVVVKEKIGVNPHTKTFSFDHVFSAHTPQIDVYRGIVTPIIEEVLMGYNCTVFAYGQTGTGKTFTMEGERTEDMEISWEEDPLAGIIPRAMHNVFERLQSSEMEYSVRVSFLELYNEELFDLLGSGDDSLRLKIYEDGTKKGSVVIQGLEEVTVHNKDDVYAILERGSAKRQTASTLMNAASSRSHTVFSAIIHTKENSIEGEELLKTGKLNLVDLAGSENIGRSGAVDKRAREAGNINQSLLTLGRVITSLVEHAPHIPYRESKLTRLLQDSLGGKTKTSIIATISPASVNLEETLSTLDYAHRAKNIQNKPEINQKLTKKALLKEYTGEIERLKKDLQAAREKNGIFIAEENYTAMQVTMAQQSDSIKELEERILVMTEEMVKINELFTETKDDLLNTRNELDSTTKTLEQTTTTLTETQNDLEETRTDRDEQHHLVIKHVDTETSLFSEANQLLQTADESTADVGGLHDKLDRKRKVESHNDQCQGQFRETFSQDVTRITDGVERFNSSQNSAIATARQQLGALVASRKAEVDTLLSDLTTLSGSVGEKLTEVESHLSQTNQLHTADIQAVSKTANSTKETVCDSVSGFEREVFGRLVSAMEGILTATQLTLHEFGGQIDTQLSAIEAREKFYLEELRRDMKSLSTSVEGYVSRTEGLLADMTTQRECAQRKDQELDSLLIELIQQKRSHFSAYCQQGEQLSESLRENLSCVSAVKKETERCEVAAEKHQSEFMSQASEHRESMHGFVKKIGESLTQCGETRKELVTETVTFRDKCHKTLSDGTDRLCDQLTRHNTHIITQQNIVCQKTQAIQHYVGDTVTQLSSVATEGQDQVTQKVGQLDGQCEAMVEEQMSFCDRTTGDVQSLGRSLETFLTQQLQKDIPTGLTPQRRDFTYPQQLTSTEPHDLLLARFRAQRQKDQVAVTLFTADDSADSAPEAEETSPDPTPVIEETSADPQRLSPTELSDKLCLPDLSDNVSEAGSDISTRSGRSGMSSKENRSRVPRSRISKLAKPSQRTPVNGPQTRRPLRTTNTPQN